MVFEPQVLFVNGKRAYSELMTGEAVEEVLKKLPVNERTGEKPLPVFIVFEEDGSPMAKNSTIRYYQYLQIRTI